MRTVPHGDCPDGRDRDGAAARGPGGARMLTLLAAALPAANFALEDWKLQLPVDGAGRRQGVSAEIADLDGYSSAWFFTGPDGAMVLVAPVDGATTRSSDYARSELREMRDGEGASWSIDEGGTLEVAMTVQALPALKAGGAAPIVIGQVHAGDAVLARIYFDGGSLYWVLGRNEAREHDLHFNLLDPRGRRPDLNLGEPFLYDLTVGHGVVEVAVEVDGATYTSRVPAGEGWDDNGLYFKAGVYLASDASASTGEGRVAIYALSASHRDAAPADDGAMRVAEAD